MAFCYFHAAESMYFMNQDKIKQLKFLKFILNHNSIINFTKN